MAPPHPALNVQECVPSEARQPSSVNVGRHSREAVRIPRRPPSARLGGIPAPYVRTSLSPDRVLRHRGPRSRRYPASAHTDIEIVSDDEVDSPPTRRCYSRHPTPSASHTPEVIDLTRLPSTPPPDVHLPSSPGSPASDHLQDPNDEFPDLNRDDRLRTTPVGLYPVSSGRRPPWLRVCIAQLYSSHPDARCVTYCNTGDPSLQKLPTSWFIKCRECDDDKMTFIPAGPGFTITNFTRHVDSIHPHLHSTSNSSRQV